MSLAGSRPACFNSMLNGPCVPPPITEMPIVFPLRSAIVFDRRVIHNSPIDREATGLLEHVLRDNVGLQVPTDDAVGERQRSLGCAIKCTSCKRLRHWRRTLELRPLDIIGFAYIRKLLRPAHHPIFELFSRNGPANADRLLRL